MILPNYLNEKPFNHYHMEPKFYSLYILLIDTALVKLFFVFFSNKKLFQLESKYSEYSISKWINFIFN